jgi:GDP-mannose 6-dehydrogenase
MDICVFGLGYVGCVSAACLARAGHHVIGVDINPEKVSAIAEGRAPLVEPGLSELVADGLASGRLSATVDGVDAIRRSRLAIICVGTPSTNHGRPDVDGVERIGQEIGEAVRGRAEPLTVVLRSTVLPGTTERVLVPAIRAGAGGDAAVVHVAMNPEFMREGTSIADFDAPPFVLIGTEDAVADADVRELYATVDAPVVTTNTRTAECVKYASNAYHGLKVCFANELARIFDALGADANEAARVFMMDHKLNISEAYLRPGFAFGGSCLPKDVRALLWAARSNDIEVPVLSAILPSNTGQVASAIDAVLATHKKRVGILGLAFKADTDDMRESPLVALTEALIGKGCHLRILDRSVATARLVGANRRYIETEIPHLTMLLCEDVDEMASHAEVLIVGTLTDDARAVLARRSADCTVIDLTRRAHVSRSAAGAPECVAS